jgi:DNA mismatch repair protein MutS
MAGKSTYIRQVAIIVLLAHTGCFVPAASATIGLTDRIFTRIGASDELHAGQSTFMVEMTETANILHHATDRSLVILDEIGRGTSTLDGLALAWAIAETIADVRCRTLFATHYHELTALADRIEHVTNLHVAVREWGDEIIFLYRILSGRTDRSYGIHVAKIAGLPRPSIDRARQVLETLAVHTETPDMPARDDAPTGPPPGAQLGLFTEYLPHPVVDALREIKLDTLSPMQAFDALRELKTKLDQVD